MALKSEDEPLQLADRKLLAARFAGLECPGALEFPDLLLEVRLVARQGAGPAGRGEPDGAEQCTKRDSHTCSPKKGARLGFHSAGGPCSAGPAAARPIPGPAPDPPAPATP